MNSNEELYYEMLFNQLLAAMPKDTRNMLHHTHMEDYGDYFVIVITAPQTTKSGYYDYAHDVNYNQQRGPKEIHNYKYVERTLRQVSQALGGSVKYEIS